MRYMLGDTEIRPKLKLADPEFVGDAFGQRIELFVKENGKEVENLLNEFSAPIQHFIERILLDNRTYKNTNEALEATFFSIKSLLDKYPLEDIKDLNYALYLDLNVIKDACNVV